MLTRTLLVRCAPLAIAASVALPAIPSLAQDAATAEPVIVLPSTPPPVAAPTVAPAAPVIVLPPEQPAPAAAVPTQPSARATAAARTAAPSPQPAAREAAVASNRVSTPAAATAASLPTDTAPADPVITAGPSETIPAAPAATPADANATAPVANATTNTSTGEVAIAALLGVLGLTAVGGVALLAARGRRRRALDRGEVAVAYEPIADAEPIAPLPEPVFTAPIQGASAFAAPVVATPGVSRNNESARRASAVANGDPVPLPNTVPQSFEERDALLKELVAAEPDKANPFTSPRARARRAKLIIQSLAHDFSNRKPRIDLSEYTNRWPALRGWQPATA